jgi:hypothetical protein
MPIAVEGLRTAVRDLEALGVDLDDLKDVFAGIASDGADLATRYAPSRSGKLRASVRGNRAKSKAVVTAGRASVAYAGPINYGWRKRGIEPSRFMQRADADLERRAVAMLEEGIDRAITRHGF